MSAGLTHLVLIPSYDTGPLLARTIAEARANWSPVWIVIDGSGDGSAETAAEAARTDPGLRVLRLDRNQGKGAAVAHGLEAAREAGFTHALVMDADGQHPADRIAAFMAASAASPDAVIMGQPVFGADAPWPRVLGRRISNGLARLQTLRAVGDALFGFRVYPIVPLLAVMRETRGMRRFDFDPEAIVRLVWRGAKLVHLPASVRYLAPEEGGVSHFNYLRDNALLASMNVRLACAGLGRLPRALARRRRTPAADGGE